MLKSLQLLTQNTLANAKVLNFFSYQLSNISRSYQAKKCLEHSASGTGVLEDFLPFYQDKELSSLAPIKLDLNGLIKSKKKISNKKLIKIPSLLGIPSIVLKEQLISNLANK